MLKHAFLMMAYKQPELVERIVKCLEAENHYIYIHYDAKSEDFNKILSICEKYCNVFVTTRKRISWGSFSQLSCQIEKFEEILNSENKYEYFHLISGQDYICVNNRKFDDFFEKNVGKSYMKLDSSEDVFEWRQNKFRYRLENYFFNDVKLLDFCVIGAKAYRYVNKLIRFIPRPYKDMNQIWGGWDWFTLHRSALEYVTDYIKNHPDFYNRFRLTSCSTELIYATILYPVADELNIVTTNSLRFVEWHPKRETRSLPLVLEETEFEDIINSNALFCRKVQLPESRKLLDMLDKHISGA